MNLFPLFDAPSLLFVLSSLLIGLIVGKNNWQKIITTTREIVLPIGSCGSLLGFIMMLSDLEDPSHIGPAFGVALLPSVYGFFLLICMDTLLSKYTKNLNDLSEKMAFSGSSILACLLVVLLPFVALLSTNSHVAILIDLYAAGLVIGGALLLSIFTTKMPKERLYKLGENSLLLAFLGTLCSAALLCASWNDPTTIAPAMALGFLSLFYGGILYTIIQILHISRYHHSLSFSNKGSGAHALGTLSFSGIAFFMIALLIG